MQGRYFARLLALRYFGFCNVLLVYIYMSVRVIPSLLIESTDSMIILVVIDPRYTMTYRLT